MTGGLNVSNRPLRDSGDSTDKISYVDGNGNICQTTVAAEERQGLRPVITIKTS